MVAIARRLRSHVPTQYLWPLLLLLGACFGGIVLLLLYTTTTEDTLQRDRETQAVEGVLRTGASMVRHDLQDYAKWDDGVRHIGRSFDREWIGDNLVAYLGETQGYAPIFILDESDGTIFSAGEEKPARHEAQKQLGQDFERSIGAVRMMPKDGGPIAAGFTRSGDRVFVYSTAAVVPLTNKISVPDGPTKLIVIAREVDRTFLAEMTRDLNIGDVRLTLQESGQGVPLIGVTGRPVAWLQWASRRPGALLRQQLVPPIAALALIAVVAAGLILRRGGLAIEDLRRSELRARHLSDHDSLTGLPNRRALVERIGDIMGRDRSLALLFLDLDGFKDANDVYGHALGDHLLKQVAERVESAAEKSFIARVGGDEFAVLVPMSSSSEAEQMCAAILAVFAVPFGIDAYQVRLGVSIGLVEARRDEEINVCELLRRADVAMYAAKAAGKRCVRSYEPSLDAGYQARIRLECDLRSAVEHHQISVCYQPIVDAQTGDMIAVEALARWHHPEHGHVPPDVFIGIAEVSGLINVIGRQVLSLACSAMKPTDLNLAVNLSPAQFWDEGLVESVQAVLHETGFPAERLELEITENQLLRRPQVAAEVIERLRSLGVRIALDDFGTGFASIGYLRQLKLDRLKVDRAFIAPLVSDERARLMLASIIGLGKASDLDVCAEGVETEEQARLARAAGCSRLQGWLYGRPVPANDILNVYRVQPVETYRAVG